jgi:hypothetical protein
MARLRLIWTFGLMALALILMSPALFLSGLTQASAEDWEVASTPVARIPLDSLQRTRSASLVFRVPAEQQWTRIRDSWGDPGYVIFGQARAPSQSVLPWNSLGIQVVATTGLGTLQLAPAGPIQNSVHSDDAGLTFRAKPGENVRLDVLVGTSVTLPIGELTVAPNWTSDGEGRAWGMLFALNLRPYSRLAFLGGIGLLMAAAIVGVWRTV